MFCSKCGIENLNEANFCKSCGAAMRIEAAPLAMPNPDSPTTALTDIHYAGFWRRGAAAIVDWQIVGGGCAAIGHLLKRESDVIQLIGQIAILLLWAVIFAKHESSADSATIGKRLFHLQVLRADKSKLSFARAAGRFFGRLVSAILFGVGYFMQPFTAKKQALHDMMTDSVVVQNKKGREGFVVAAWLFQILLLVIAVAVSVITLRAEDAPASNDNQELNSSKVESPISDSSSHFVSQESCDAADNSLWYDYEPAIVSLRGKLVSAKGQTPDEQEVSYPALQLEGSISVHGSDEANQAERGVALIQLALGASQWPVYKELGGQNVVVTGTLYHGFNGHHYTNVLMTPTKMVVDKASCAHSAQFIPLEAFTVNLQRDQQKDDQYLQVGISLKVLDPLLVKKIGNELPVIRSRINLLLSGKYANELMTAKGKAVLATEIKAETNAVLGFSNSQGGNNGVTEVMFTSFIIQ